MTEPRTIYDPGPEAGADTPLTDLGQVRRRKRKAVSTERDLEATLHGLMSVEAGRRWVWWLLGLCHIGHQPAHIVPQRGTVDVPRSFMNFGEMNIGHQLMAQINRACPDKYLKMVEEANQKEETDA